MVRRDQIVSELRCQSTWQLVILSIITLGIYEAHYIVSQTKVINRHVHREDQISGGLTNTILVLAYLSVILIVPYILVPIGHSVERLSNSVDTALAVLGIVWAFTARNRMHKLLAPTKEQYYWFHGLWTFLFTAWYFNYKVNELNTSLLERDDPLYKDPTPLHPGR